MSGDERYFSSPVILNHPETKFLIAKAKFRQKAAVTWVFFFGALAIINVVFFKWGDRLLHTYFFKDVTFIGGVVFFIGIDTLAIAVTSLAFFLPFFGRTAFRVQPGDFIPRREPTPDLWKLVEKMRVFSRICLGMKEPDEIFYLNLEKLKAVAERCMVVEALDYLLAEKRVFSQDSSCVLLRSEIMSRKRQVLSRNYQEMVNADLVERRNEREEYYLRVVGAGYKKFLAETN